RARLQQRVQRMDAERRQARRRPEALLQRCQASSGAVIMAISSSGRELLRFLETPPSEEDLAEQTATLAAIEDQRRRLADIADASILDVATLQVARAAASASLSRSLHASSEPNTALAHWDLAQKMLMRWIHEERRPGLEELFALWRCLSGSPAGTSVGLRQVP